MKGTVPRGIWLAGVVAFTLGSGPMGPTAPARAQTRPSTPSRPLRPLTIVAPAAPGGGWDRLAREMQHELDRQRFALAPQVENVPGAAGTIGLAQLITHHRADPDVLLVTGLVMLGAIQWNESPVSLAQATPIARLTGEYEVVAVPAGSPHRDLRSLVAALRANPEAVSWGGGSAGGTDHILAGLIVAASGLDPRRTNYIAFAGGGEAVAALLGGQLTAGISGFSEFAPHVASGRLRIVGVSSPARLPSVDAPTLQEQGLDVTLENWRGVVAAPGLEDRDRRSLIDMVRRMTQTAEWRATLDRLGWTDSYLAGSDFDAFLQQERLRVGRIVGRLRGRSGPVAGGAAEWAFPSIVILACVVTFVRLVTARPRGTLRDGESAAGPGRGPVVRVAAALLGFVLLLEPAGFVPAGALLFAVTASAFGSRRWLRDALVGLAIGAAVFVGFTHGLGIRLP